MLTRSSVTGFTQIELLISVSILGILAALVVPSFRSLLERNEIIAVAEALSADLRWARSEALKRHIPIKVSFTPAGVGAWRYVINTVTVDPVTLKIVNSAQIPEFKTVTFAENFRDNETVFEPVRGTTEGKNGTATFSTSANNYRVKVILSNLGRVRICAELGDIGGYASCV
ncbi:MAG: GspH/FimT family pseudopilin [Methylococcaceae bacterium]